MKDAGLKPTARASRSTLVRRLYLDLTGTTPTPDDVKRFLEDNNPGAYARLVDHLLALTRLRGKVRAALVGASSLQRYQWL